jgi:nicotinate dehydrogenase subunit B
MMRQPMQRGLHAGCQDARSGCNGCESKNMPGSRSALPWSLERRLGWMRKVTSSIGSTTSGVTLTRRGRDRLDRCSPPVLLPLPEPTPKPIPMPEGGGDRNSVPLYKFPRTRVTYHFLPSMPIRVSSMRALGAYANIFAIESFMDELAARCGADPVDYRLRHLDDARARDVVATAAERFDWKGRTHGTPDRGSGFAFARYKNLAAYCAVACEVEVDRESGRVRPLRFVAAVDSGQVVNPNGIANQIEGAILQSISWTLHEQVTFDRHRITSLNWASYPILRFSSVPDTVDVHILNRPGQPFLGTGEAGQGPTAAALANAIADATGQRLRDLPLSPARIKAAMK